MSQIKIEDREEAERGCGFRKPGGKYLVGGHLGSHCDRLPAEMKCCKACNQGIRPQRGFQWIEPAALLPACLTFGGQHSCQGALGCLLADPLPARAGLMWVGGAYYPTPASWATEARGMGASRRISNVPKGLQLGATIILVGHRKCNLGLGLDSKPRLGPGVFAAFIPERLEYVVRDDDSPEKLERLAKSGWTLVRVHRKEGAEQST